MIIHDEMVAPDWVVQAALKQLELRLQDQLGGRVRNLRLVMRDDGIILQGIARTYYAKQLAQHSVMRQTDLPILVNEIEVA